MTMQNLCEKKKVCKWLTHRRATQSSSHLRENWNCETLAAVIQGKRKYLDYLITVDRF